MKPARLTLAMGALLIATLLPTPANALVVDWDTVTWNPGDTTNSYNIDPGTPGNDVTVTVTAKNNVLTTDSNTAIQTPLVGTSITGGLSPVQNSFEIAGNLKTNSEVTMTVNFNPAYVLGSSGVTFTIFDVDVGTNPDEIQTIYGIAPDGTTHIAATISSLGPNVSLSGTGLTQQLTGTGVSANSGAGSGNSNATITFNSPIIGFSFLFANGNGAPSYQDIAVGDIYFIPVPEADAAFPVLLLAGLAGFVAQMRRDRR
jgi:hypothetical protein